MCGYCIEVGVAFDFIERENTSEKVEENDCWMPIYLQESENLIGIINKQKATDHLARSIDVVLYRIWEMLLFQEKFEVCRLLIYELDQRAKNDFFLRIRNGSLSEMWKPLGEDEIYVDFGAWRRFISNKELLISCATSSLNQYYNFWVLGVGKEISDPDVRFEKTGILDPIENTTSKDWDRFYSLFSIAYFSFLVLLRYQNDAALIKRIALGAPHDVPDFFGYDLWLQRKAFAACVEKYGIQFIQDNFDYIRLELIYYTLLKGVISLADFDKLKNHLLSHEHSANSMDSDSVIDLINELKSAASKQTGKVHPS